MSSSLPLTKALQHSLTSIFCELLTKDVATDHLIVALSGGIDSMVLLDALCQYRDEYTLPPIQAVYVNHGLSPNADDWGDFCAAQCMAYDVDFYRYTVTVNRSSRTSLENQARKARYQCLGEHAQQHRGVVLTAQHADDQLETVLLQLKRGSGPKGLAGMALLQQKRLMWLARPLLGIGRADIEQYAQQNQISWIEDESNEQIQFDRNFLRHCVIPELTERWPSIATTVSRSARLCAQSQRMIEQACDAHLNELLPTIATLSYEPLSALSVDWKHAVVRRWLERFHQIIPSEAQLYEVMAMLDARDDKQPHVILGRVCIRRHQRCLHVTPWPLPAPTTWLIKDEQWIDTGYGVEISVRFTPPLPTQDALYTKANGPFELRTGVSNQSIKLAGSVATKKLFNWFKEQRVAPWERQCVPILFHNDEAVAIVLRNETRLLTLSESVAKGDGAWIYRRPVSNGNLLPSNDI